MQGWVPGPRLFIDHTSVLYGVIMAEFVSMIVLFIVGAAFCLLASRVVQVPTRVLIPVVTIFALIGAFSERNLLFDASIVFIFGLIGWYLRRNEYPVIAVVLGLILGPIADQELLRSVQLYGDQTWLAFFQRPISLIMMMITVAGALTPFILKRVRKKRIEESSQHSL